jgi:hypothetical protein
MTAPISVAYEDWKATIDAANKAQERVKKLETHLQWIINECDDDDNYRSLRGAVRNIARKALEE